MAKDQPEQKSDDKKPTWVTLVSLLLSAAAFIVSTITTVLSTFWIDDSIRVVVRGVPVVLHQPNVDEIGVGGACQWIIMNSGNRTVAITGAQFVLAKDDSSDDSCSENIVTMVQFNLEPFVLQPKQVEIKAHKLRLFDQATWKPIDSDTVTIKPFNAFGQKLKACLVTQFVTPEAAFNKSKVIYRMMLKRDEQSFSPDPKTMVKPTEPIKPWILIHDIAFGFYESKPHSE